MDLGLPDQDGYEVTTKIHQWQKQHQHPLSIIVALSAHLGEAETPTMLVAGMIRAYERPLLLVEDAEELLRADKKEHADTYGETVSIFQKSKSLKP